MTTPSGTISMSNINTECGYASNRNTNLNEFRPRRLANISSGQISFDNLRNKSSAMNVYLSISFWWAGREVWWGISNGSRYDGYYELRNYGDYCWDCILFTAWDTGFTSNGSIDLYFGPNGQTDPAWYPAPKSNAIHTWAYDIFDQWTLTDHGWFTSS